MDRKKLALIHIVKKELGLSDEEYRGILRQQAGVESARDLTDDSFRLLMRFLVRSRYYRLTPEGLTLRQRLYIQHLQQRIGWSDEHLANFLRKYFKRDAVEDLSRPQASKAILALEHMALDPNRTPSAVVEGHYPTVPKLQGRGSATPGRSN